jgi:Bacterial regulatory proteins, luxR family
LGRELARRTRGRPLFLRGLVNGTIETGVLVEAGGLWRLVGEFDTAVAAGRANQRIAADSHLAVRIVESHLQRAYAKLGITSRHELAGALRGQLGI